MELQFGAVHNNIFIYIMKYYAYRGIRPSYMQCLLCMSCAQSTCVYMWTWCMLAAPYLIIKNSYVGSLPSRGSRLHCEDLRNIEIDLMTPAGWAATLSAGLIIIYELIEVELI